MRLLVIETSILGEQSVSRQITREVVARLRGDAADGAVTVIERDLAAAPLDHLTLSTLPPVHPRAPEASRDSDGARASQAVLDEFLAADTVVVGAPMYNFTIPSQLKAWIDRVIVPGTTFRRGPDGVEGLAGDKRIVVVIARGGFYGQGSPAAALEHLETYLRTTFGFIGVTRLEVVIAEGLAAGGDDRDAAIERAVTVARGLRAA